MHAIIFLNGELPDKKLVNKFIEKKNIIIAADGGAGYLKKNMILPDVILGDLDSVEKNTLRYFAKKKTRIIKIKEQETTDFEKCLRFCLGNKLNKVIVFGGTGKRPDHALNNFSVMLRFSKKIDIKMVTDEFDIFFIGRQTKFKYKKNELISLLGFPIAKKVSTSGVKYKLSNEDLKLGEREGVLNESVSKIVTVKYKSGSLLLFKKHFLNN